MKVYDYDNKSIEIELPDKPIARIHVVILSGDETGTITFADGSKIDFDASHKIRYMSFFGGEYDVEGDMIPRWMAYVPRVARHEVKAHKRHDWFEREIHK